MAIKTFEDIFSFWDSIPDMADDVGESSWTVQKWWQRKRIPDTAWVSVIAAAKKRGKSIDADTLLTIHSAPRRRSNSSRADAH